MSRNFAFCRDLWREGHIDKESLVIESNKDTASPVSFVRLASSAAFAQVRYLVGGLNTVAEDAYIARAPSGTRLARRPAEGPASRSSKACPRRWSRAARGIQR